MIHPLSARAEEALGRAADRAAVEFGGRVLTVGDLRAVAMRVRAFLAESGAPRGAPVVFVPRNRPESLAAFLALLAEGRAVKMLYSFQSAQALANALHDRAPSVALLHAEDFQGAARDALETLGAATLALDSLIATATPARLRREAPSELAPQAVEILTSGTTGTPKPFALSYDLLEGVVSERSAVGAERLAPFLLYFPLSNISGVYAALPPLLAGQRIELLDRFDLGAWREHVMRHRPRHAGLPPSFVAALLDADIPKADLSSLEALGVGAAPLDPDVQTAFEARYAIPILVSYGATEFGGPVTATTRAMREAWGAAKIGSVGQAIGGARLRVVNPATDEILPSGVEGVLEVVAPRIGERWIRTADRAVLDADGFLFLRGRADGAILRGGFKILPETVERALATHPAVADAAVIGVSDRRLGQAPAAAVKLRAGVRAPTPQELETHLRQTLPATHVPVKLLFLQEFPQTVSLKTDRGALAVLLNSAD